jgi:hypothetical protein
MAKTYKPIATTTLGSAAASYTFSSIPATYTDLVLISQAKSSSTITDNSIYFNGDTATNYSITGLTGNGSAASSYRESNKTIITIDGNGYVGTSDFNLAIVHIMNYSNTTTFKTVLSRSNNGAAGVDAVVGLWRSTAAITSLTLDLLGASNFTSGSTFTLYGIKSA